MGISHAQSVELEVCWRNGSIRLKILRMVVNREIIQSLLLIQTARVVLIAIAIAQTGKCTLVFFIRQTCNW